MKPTSTDPVRCFNDSNGDRDCHLCARLGGCEHFGKNPVAWGPPPKCVILDEAVWDKELSDAVLSDNWDFDAGITPTLIPTTARESHGNSQENAPE